MIFFFWENFLFLKVFINAYFLPNINYPKVFYGGARKGSLGGPLVKVKKLEEFFPEQHFRFNIIYLLSNSLYLSPKSIYVLKKKNIPIVLNQNGVYYSQWFKGNWEKENSRMSKFYHSADYVLWQSKFCRKAADKFLGKRLGFGEIIYNSVNTSIFKPAKKTDKKTFSFLITGNITKNSNYRISSVLYAINELINDYKFINLKIAGKIEDKRYFLKQIKFLKLENHVHFFSKYTQREAPKIYQNVDAYITMAYQDNCPTAVLEAMACGLPILYSSSGGIPELVDKNSGLGLKVSENWKETIVPSRQSIKEGMIKIIENKSEMSSAARNRTIENFDSRDWIKKHEVIFESLIKKQNNF